MISKIQLDLSLCCHTIRTDLSSNIIVNLKKWTCTVSRPTVGNAMIKVLIKAFHTLSCECASQMHLYWMVAKCYCETKYLHAIKMSLYFTSFFLVRGFSIIMVCSRSTGKVTHRAFSGIIAVTSWWFLLFSKIYSI